MIADGVEISNLAIQTIASKEVNINTQGLIGTIILTSEHGFNKVIDADTESVMLYSGVWTVSSTNLTLSELKLVFPLYEVHQHGADIYVIIDSECPYGDSIKDSINFN